MWRLPFVLIIQDRSEEGGDHRPLWPNRSSKEQRGNINASKFKASVNLFDEVSLEVGVSAGSVRKTQGNDVGHSLRLMDDSFHIRQVFPVLYPHLAVSHHPVELLLDPI